MQLKAGTRAHCASWADALERHGARIERDWTPAATSAGVVDAAERQTSRPQLLAAGSTLTPARWRLSVPGFQVLNDERGKPFALFSIEATRCHGAAEERFSCARRFREVTAFQALAKASTGLGSDALPSLPETRMFNKLEQHYLEGKTLKLQAYLQALAEMAQPDLPPRDETEGATQQQLRGLLRVFLDDKEWAKVSDS